ncbi:MAG TPA: DUF2827 family protein [Caulobacteraceae bacterium]|nr:DUF2827 family protein [Caulobacteraceae bacterium]
MVVQAPRRGLKVGITVVAGTDPHGALWSSGIHQNMVFLALLFQRLPQVELCAFVSCPPGGPATHPLAELYGFPTLQLSDIDKLDVLIEMGARAETEFTGPFRDKGGKLVSYVAGNTMIMNFETLANGVPYGDFINEVPFDSVWITPQHWRTNHAYCAITRTPATELAPHIWSPLCLEQSAFQLKVNPFWRAPTEPDWRIGVFDPNVNVVKTFHFPLLVCEQAARLEPELINRVLLFSASQLMGNPHFEQFCAALDLGRRGRVFAEQRYLVAQMLGSHIDAVVTHQWENALNYLYWDVLYLGWPLIHNSPDFEDAGYYYPAFDPKSGGEVLREALKSHAATAQAQRPKVLDTLWRFSIDNPAVQKAHAELLEKLTS